MLVPSSLVTLTFTSFAPACNVTLFVLETEHPPLGQVILISQLSHVGLIVTELIVSFIPVTVYSKVFPSNVLSKLPTDNPKFVKFALLLFTFVVVVVVPEFKVNVFDAPPKSPLIEIVVSFFFSRRIFYFYSCYSCF